MKLPNLKSISEGKRTKSDKKSSGRLVDIDMNPVVDLAFLLLTFFMLTTTFRQPQAMELVMPAKALDEAVEQEQPIKESKAMTIVMIEDNRIFYYMGISEPEVFESSYNSNGIRSILLEKGREIPDLVVLIKAGELSNYRNLVDIIDEMAITETKRYALVDFSATDRKLIAEFL